MPEGEEAACDGGGGVVFDHELAAAEAALTQLLWMGYYLLEEGCHGVNVDRGVEDGAVGAGASLAYEVVVFGFAAAYGALAVCHCEKGVGGGGVAVGLVYDNVGAFEQFDVFFVRAVFDYYKFGFAGVALDGPAGGCL